METDNFLKEISYQIYNPGGNITALVEGCGYSSEEKKRINQMIMDKNPMVEQVGFLSTNENRLEMAGGEFCLNATRCAVFAYAKERRNPHQHNGFRNAKGNCRVLAG